MITKSWEKKEVSISDVSFLDESCKAASLPSQALPKVFSGDLQVYTNASEIIN